MNAGQFGGASLRRLLWLAILGFYNSLGHVFEKPSDFVAHAGIPAGTAFHVPRATPLMSSSAKRANWNSGYKRGDDIGYVPTWICYDFSQLSLVILRRLRKSARTDL